MQLHSVHCLPQTSEETIYSFSVKSHQSAITGTFCFTQNSAWVPSQRANQPFLRILHAVFLIYFNSKPESKSKTNLLQTDDSLVELLSNIRRQDCVSSKLLQIFFSTNPGTKCPARKAMYPGCGRKASPTIYSRHGELQRFC
jgi:hypothetical protein